MDPEKPSLAAALRELKAEAQESLGPHPSPEELAAYQARELGEDEAEPLRNHLALCRQCAELILDLAHFDELEPPEGASRLTDDDLDAAWTKLRSRLDLGTKTPVEPVEPLKLVPSPPVKPRPLPPPSGTRAHRYVPLWALAASLLLAVMGFSLAGYFNWKSQQSSQNLAILELDPLDSTRGLEETSAPADAGSFDFRLALPEGGSAAVLKAEVRRSRGGVVKMVRGLRERNGEVTFSLRAGSLSPGGYTIYLFALDRPVPGAEYAFKITKAP